MQDVQVLDEENWRIEGVVCHESCSEVRKGKTRSQMEGEWKAEERESNGKGSKGKGILREGETE